MDFRRLISTFWARTKCALAKNRHLVILLTYCFCGYALTCIATASGPTLTDYYCPDIDRHRSGLNCFARDHERTLFSRDLDVPPATEVLDREDLLTDSESDDDDAYKKTYPIGATTSEKPSLAAARLVLRTPQPVEAAPSSPAGKGKKGGPGPAATPVALSGGGDQQTADSSAESFALKDADRRCDQVELMRDRKILEMENVLKSQREKNSNDITERYFFSPA